MAFLNSNLIDPHWLQFPQPSENSYLALTICYLIIFIVGVSGNGLVILTFTRCKSLRTGANVLIGNLAISDSLMLIKMPLFIYNGFQRGPALGNLWCQIYGFVGGLSGTASIVCLTTIAFDRYQAVKFPLKSLTKKKTIFYLLIPWIYGLAFSLPPLLGLHGYQYEGYLISCSFAYLSQNSSIKIYIFVFAFAAFVVPLCVISFSYINILQVVGDRATALTGNQEGFVRHMKEEQKRKQDTKLALVVFSTICLWFLAWTPYAIVALLGVTGQKHLLTPTASMIPAVFCKTASALDPYVYAITHPKFQWELRRSRRRIQYYLGVSTGIGPRIKAELQTNEGVVEIENITF
ncbi:hypothetical protein ABEB36_014208 [Hypothenemus hampei]|uniref:G-protein coupled receptors family 1 profile domain-containing protein n=1 Tax=Hypothenemus hampei TaxID=57062 RepID=A0ABD1E3L6_HYPHA